MGAIAPTSSAVANKMAELIAPDPWLTVVELGAGTGAISVAIGPRLGPDARHIAVERETELLDVLQRKAPWAQRVNCDVRELCGQLAERDVPKAEVILSSLPWSNFSAEAQRAMLGQVTKLLTKDGVFATIAYRPTRLTPRSRRFRAALRESFGEVVPTATMWANLPPARLYICRRPRTGD